MPVQVDFTASVKIGDPAVECTSSASEAPFQWLSASNFLDTLLLDTGSANTWVGNKQSYSPSSTSHNTGHSVVSAVE